MVKETTLRFVRDFVDELETSYGKLSFALALPNIVGDENTSLTLFLASSWIENKSNKETLTAIIEKLRNQLGTNAASVVSRVSLVSIDDPFARTFYSARITKSITVLINCRFGAAEIPEAYIFENIPA